jgi:hypothetical protein
MSPRRPKNVIAVTPGGDITLDMLIGFYAMFSVPEKAAGGSAISSAKLRRLWMAEVGDPGTMIPKTPKAVHAFQRACRSVESRRPADEADSRVTEIKVNKVLENAEECVYQINRLIRDRDEKLIEHPKAMRITFTAKDQGIVSEPLDAEEAEVLFGIDDRIREHFEANSAKISASKVRAAFRRTLEEIGGTKVVRNGVYFIPRTGHETLLALQRVLEITYGADSSAELHLIPAADTGSEKDMIAKHFTVNASKEADKLIATVAHYLKDREGDVRSNKLKNIIAARRRLATSAEKYSDILDTELTLVAEKMEILDDQIETLAVKSGKRVDE